MLGVVLLFSLTFLSSVSRSLSTSSTVGLTVAALVAATLAAVAGALCVPVEARSWAWLLSVTMPVHVLVALATSLSVAEAGGAVPQVLVAAAPWLLGGAVGALTGRQVAYAAPPWRWRGRRAGTRPGRAR
ncbi:MAG TPA: hypothetical protein VF661_11340 [Actinomycetales bacterium]